MNDNIGWELTDDGQGKWRRKRKGKRGMSGEGEG